VIQTLSKKEKKSFPLKAGLVVKLKVKVFSLRHHYLLKLAGHTEMFKRQVSNVIAFIIFLTSLMII